MLVACLIKVVGGGVDPAGHIIAISKINNGVYCIEINGTDYMFQTYADMYDCMYELLDAGYKVLSNESSIVNEMVTQWNLQIFYTDRKTIREVEEHFESI